MNNKRNRRIAMIVAVLMLTMAFSTTGFAAWMGKTIQAQYRNISIFVNGEYKQAKTEAGVVVEPFIVDGTTYVPLRGISEILGYKVAFNPATYRIDVSGSGMDTAAQYEILILKAQIKELEDQLAEIEDAELDVNDLESDLKSDHRYFDDLSITDIEVYGDKEEISLEIYVDTSDDDEFAAWKALDDSDIEYYLERIADDILAVAEDVKISGFIEDEYDDKQLVDFTVDSRGNISLDGTSDYADIDDLGALEDAVKADFDKIMDLNIADLDLYGDTNDIEIVIEIDTTDDAQFAEFKSLNEDDFENYIEDVVGAVLSADEFDNADITGYIFDKFDDADIVLFETDNSGNVSFDFR